MRSSKQKQKSKANPRTRKAADFEQEARIALLEHYGSQMQGYKLYVLSLVIGLVGVVELSLRVKELPVSYKVGMTIIFAIIGFIVAGACFCTARFAWYGKLTYFSLLAEPSQKPLSTLLHKLDVGICEAAHDYSGDWVSLQWRRIVRIGSCSRQLVLMFFFVWAFSVSVFLIIGIIFNL